MNRSQRSLSSIFLTEKMEKLNLKRASSLQLYCIQHRSLPTAEYKQIYALDTNCHHEFPNLWPLIAVPRLIISV